MKNVLKWGGRLVLVIVIIFLIISVFAFFFRPSIPPSVEKAPYVLQTYTNDQFRLPSRYYYGEAAEYIDGVLMLTGHWWNYDGKNYHKHKGDKPFPVDEYGKVDLRRR
jgi:hypothetical protein